MLIRLRDVVRSWIALVFIVLLALSFAVWGLSDIFIGRTNDALLSVGKRNIFPADLDQALDTWLRREAEAGNRTNRSEAAQTGALNSILSSLAGEALLLAYADEIAVSASKYAVAKEIGDAPIFRDPLTGGFDQDNYREYLQQIGLSPQEFETELRDSMTYSYLSGSPALGFGSAEVLARVWSYYVGEGRNMSFVVVAEEDIPDPGEPDEEQLQKFMADHSEQYMLPERRQIALLELSGEDFMDRFTPDEADIDLAYRKRIKEFSAPETRVLVELSASNRRVLEVLHDQLGAGTALNEALKQAGDAITQQEKTLDADKLDEESDLLKAGFNLGYGQSLPPFRDPDDPDLWKSVAVRNIKPGKTRPLSEVRELIDSDLRARKAEEAMYEQSEQLYDLVGAGAALDEIANQFGGIVRYFAPIDRNGETASGVIIDAFTPYDEALPTAFKLDQGEISGLFETDEGVALLAVESIIPASLPDPETMQDRLVQAWRSAQRQIIVDNVVMALEGADSFELLEQTATSFDLPALKFERVLHRYSRQDNLDTEMIRAVFTAEPGVATAIERNDGTRIVILVEEVINPKLDEADAPILERAREVVPDGLLRDLQMVFRNEIEAELKLQINEERIDSYINTLAGSP